MTKPTIQPLNMDDPPTDREFMVRLEDKFGRFDFGRCVMRDGKVCVAKSGLPLHESVRVIGWREIAADDQEETAQ